MDAIYKLQIIKKPEHYTRQLIAPAEYMMAPFQPIYNELQNKNKHNEDASGATDDVVEKRA
jgi:hypothetical protein